MDGLIPRRYRGLTVFRRFVVVLFGVEMATAVFSATPAQAQLAPTVLVTQATPTATLGQPIFDTATVTGGIDRVRPVSSPPSGRRSPRS